MTDILDEEDADGTETGPVVAVVNVDTTLVAKQTDTVGLYRHMGLWNTDATTRWVAGLFEDRLR